MNMTRITLIPRAAGRHAWRPCVYLLALCWSSLIATTVSAQTISTVAGNGVAGYGGDGNLAISANLNRPQGLATDSAGNFYIADTDNHRIRKVSPAGVITTVAGNGVAGFGGDGGAAFNASLNFPRNVAVDPDGNIYVADRNNSRIRKISTSGVITTFAGNGTNGFSGDNGPAIDASLGRPYGVAVDTNGNVFIADTNNNRVRRVALDGTISTVVGTGAEASYGDGGLAVNAAIDGVARVAVDISNNLYVAESNRVRKVTVAGIISTVAGTGVEGFSGDGGPAIDARLASNDAMGIDSQGNLYIVDSFNHRVRKVDVAGIISTVAGSETPGFSGDGGPAVEAGLLQPIGLALDSVGNMYISDFGNNRIRKVTNATPAQMVSGLITLITQLQIPNYTRIALTVPLRTIMRLLERRSIINDQRACRLLSAYVDGVELIASRGRLGLTISDAVRIVFQAESIARSVGCPA